MKKLIKIITLGSAAAILGTFAMGGVASADAVIINQNINNGSNNTIVNNSSTGGSTSSTTTTVIHRRWWRRTVVHHHSSSSSNNTTTNSVNTSNNSNSGIGVQDVIDLNIGDVLSNNNVGLSILSNNLNDSLNGLDLDLLTDLL